LVTPRITSSINLPYDGFNPFDHVAAGAPVRSFHLILPFLRPIAHLIQGPDVSEIMIKAGGRVFLDRDGVLEEADDVHLQEKNLQVAARNIARTLSDDVSEKQSLLDARLPDGSRVAAVDPGPREAHA
jgi:pilus assembly protein CpaF